MARGCYALWVSELSSKLLHFFGALSQVQPLVIAAVLGALWGCGLRALLLLVADRGRGPLRALGRILAAGAFAAIGAGYALLTAAMLDWDRATLFAAGGAAAAMVSGVLFWRVLLRRPVRVSLTSALFRATLLLTILLFAALTLMRSGFLALTTDRPILRIDVTGETRPQTVRWAAPDQPMQEQSLTAHHIVLRSPDSAGAAVAEAWLYGDQVAIKGRVLRLSPLLNVAGIANLFELQFMHNGYFTAERHNAYPHHAQALAPMGPLAVHPRWRPLRDRLYARWEKQSQPSKSEPNSDSRWAIRAATTESTYFPLVDDKGQPIHHTYELVLTPGGLTAR